ncbi:uncharacterized protein F5147DRAFT_656961 [Suillus discolor]|uniref:Uncharacterized protein n=1 Tax=Suillus discolor TaxID=1912936 RepID=A0A9P7EYD0_9AGAM|nr:uncharacterized protein F5147DRAFT_656961 [Suillus discolor]KAG2095314.1 hypothetical protein F5147DRAFT_656961 [Suillus discolor]
MAAVQVPPQSIFRHYRLDYEGLNKGGANSPPNDHEQDFHRSLAIANSTTRRTRRTATTPTKRRARSLYLSDTGPYDSSDEGINAPVTPPPIIRSLSRYVRSAKAQPKPYERRDPSTVQRRYAASQLSPTDSGTLPDTQKGKVLLENRLQSLSPEAIAQAVLTKQADVEWRRMRALTTAWEIQAIEEHKRFLQMVLEDDSDTYVNAASEPWDTSLQGISRGNVDELNERLHFCVAVYKPDITSLAVGDKQLDLVEGMAHSLVNDCVDGDRLLDFTSLDDSEDQCGSGCESESIDSSRMSQDSVKSDETSDVIIVSITVTYNTDLA